MKSFTIKLCQEFALGLERKVSVAFNHFRDFVEPSISLVQRIICIHNYDNLKLDVFSIAESAKEKTIFQHAQSTFSNLYILFCFVYIVTR